jgi:hypothetical protein
MYLTHVDGTDHHVTDEVLWRKDGTPFPVEYTSMPIKKDGRVVGAVVTFMDITERKEMELRCWQSANGCKRYWTPARWVSVYPPKVLFVLPTRVL